VNGLPAWLTTGILVLATYRIVRLIGWDEFPPVARVRDRLLQVTVDRSMTERHPQGQPPRRAGRPGWQQFVECPYCSGFWIGLLILAVYWAAGDWTLVVLAPFALNGAVGITARMLDP
jgi:hypothetical protein